MNETLKELFRNIETVSPNEAAGGSLLERVDLYQDDKGYIPKDYRNILRIFAQDPDLQGTIAFNTLDNRVVFRRHLPWRACTNPSNGSEWTDSDTLQFKRYAGDNYKLVFRAEIINEAIDMLAGDNRFCPIKRFLDGLTWDGTPRIASALHDYLGAEDNAYTREVSRLFFHALVARAYRAGCKFDHVIILQGGQGIGKSSFLRLLGGDWYSDNIRKFEGKEAIEALNGVWLGEIAELQGFSKAGFEEIKAFITRTEDRARPAYGRRVESHPRRTIFVGTTNADAYLRDATGNRRFFPIVCHKKLDFEALAQAREQLFAEAVALYKANEHAPLILQDEQAIALALEAQQEAAYVDEWEPIIKAWLAEKIREDYWNLPALSLYPSRDGRTVQWFARDKASALEVQQECLELSKEKINTATGRRVADIMKRLGWIQGNYRFGTRYPKSRGYKRPAEQEN